MDKNSIVHSLAAKMYSMMDILADYGNELRMPYSEHLEDGIFEVRAIVKARKEQQITQADLAARTGINQGDISRLERP